MEIVNGIIMVIIGLFLSTQGSEICDRHGEHGLAIGVGVSGYAITAVGALNVMYGLEQAQQQPEPVRRDTVRVTRIINAAPDTLAWVPVRVETWTRHDLGYVADTVTALGPWHLSSGQWTFKSNKGETRSDKMPEIIQ